MRLFIAEKPSLARAIADVLPGPQQRRDGHIQCGDDLVAWCAGHILELAQPEAYDPAFRQWRAEHLPIAPREWKLEPSTPELLAVIRRLLPRASRVIHAGDPDREGQLLVDEVLEYLGHRGPVDRLLVSDLNPPAVRRALDDIKPNAHYRGLYEAALARQRADWLYGINLTRLYTILGRAGGYDGVLSVGRVQTPLLGLIVRRDLEIERFQPRAYYVVRAEVRCSSGSLIATWRAPADAAGLVDQEGRLIDRSHALHVQARVSDTSGVVANTAREHKAEPPLLPYSLPVLQVDAGRYLGVGPKETLEACQSLYEKHRLLTYPRSDCSFLPEGQLAQATTVLAAVATNLPTLVPLVNVADRALKSRAWNDKKVTAHHAIIPTFGTKPLAELGPVERGVYELVVRRYLAQFYGPYEYDEARVELEIAGERFRATGRTPTSQGWRAVVAADERDERDDRRDADEPSGQALPRVLEGDTVTCAAATVTDKQTTPPRRFTDAALIQAMTGIGRFVDDPQIRKLLKETDGIGTPATQAQIIQTLFERKFIEKRGRQVHSTAVGRALIQVLPTVSTRPDMTALWEAAMRRISEGQMSLDAFLAAVAKQIEELVAAGRALGSLNVPRAATSQSKPAARSRARRSSQRPSSKRVAR
jgi:DNA topoisomerase-3